MRVARVGAVCHVPPPPVQDSFGRSACTNMTFTKVSATTSKMAVLMLTLAAFGYAMFSASKVVDDISIPTTHNEALSGPQAPLWQAAIDRELKSIESFNTWEPVDRDKVPPDSTLMRLKWVFDLKRDQLGNIIKHKARLVCQGFRQRYGIDYLDVYAPVLKYASIRITCASRILRLVDPSNGRFHSFSERRHPCPPVLWPSPGSQNEKGQSTETLEGPLRHKTRRKSVEHGPR